VQQPQQLILIRHQLLQRVPLDPWHDRANQPALLAHLDHRDQCAILFKSGERSAQVIRMRRGILRRLGFGAAIVPSLAARPIASRMGRAARRALVERENTALPVSQHRSRQRI